MQQSSRLVLLSFATLAIITYLKFDCLMLSLPRQWHYGGSRSSAGNNGSYTAPMDGCDDAEDVVPDEYKVFLHKGFSLDSHKAFASEAVDLNLAIRSILNETVTYGLHNHAHLGKDALAAVRDDIGVDLVLCDAHAHPARSSVAWWARDIELRHRQDQYDASEL